MYLKQNQWKSIVSCFKLPEAPTGGVLQKKVLFKISQYSQESLYNKVAGLKTLRL